MVLDRVDVLAARVRDLEDENESLKDVIERSTQRNEVLITLETVTEADPDTARLYESGDFSLDKAGQSIELVRGGRYLVSLHFAEGTGDTYEIQINGDKMRTLSSSCLKMQHQTLTFVVCVPSKAQFRVVARGANKSPAGSLLTITPV